MFRSYLPSLRSFRCFSTPSYTDKLPSSPSYYAPNPLYQDLVMYLEDKIVDNTAQPLSTILWLSKDDMEHRLNAQLKPREYKDLLSKFNLLSGNSEMQSFLDNFKRPAEQQRKERPVQLPDEMGRAFGFGKRKEAEAQVTLVEGEGMIVVNGKALAEAFIAPFDALKVTFPFQVTGTLGKYNAWATVKGGGESGQSEALAHAIAQALVVYDLEHIEPLKTVNLLTGDGRRKERKKPGRAKARKRFAWVKR